MIYNFWFMIDNLLFLLMCSDILMYLFNVGRVVFPFHPFAIHQRLLLSLWWFIHTSSTVQNHIFIQHLTFKWKEWNPVKNIKNSFNEVNDLCAYDGESLDNDDGDNDDDLDDTNVTWSLWQGAANMVIMTDGLPSDNNL